MMYAAASLAVAFGVANGGTGGVPHYWALGAVLNVPFLAQAARPADRARAVRLGRCYVCRFIAGTRSPWCARPRSHRGARTGPAFGKEVFGDGTAAYRLPQLIAIPAYLVLVGGTLWSAWRMRGRPELRDRFWGTLLVAFGVWFMAGFGAAFAALGHLAPFSISLLVGIALMFIGFLRATRTAQVQPR